MFQILKKDGSYESFDEMKIIRAIEASAERAMFNLTDEQKQAVVTKVKDRLEVEALIKVPVEKIHNLVELALDDVAPIVAESYRSYRDRKSDFSAMMKRAYNNTERIMYSGDKENANKDSQLNSTQGALIRDGFMEEYYIKTFLTDDEAKAQSLGAIYIHDKAQRPLEANCCLFDMGNVLHGGFNMGNMYYNEPKTLDVAFDVIGDIVLGAASQQYGGFTVPEVDTILAPYAEKSYERYYDKYISMGVSEDVAEKQATEDVRYDFKQGWQGWEYKFNTVASSRGDYPFITVTLGLNTTRFGKMCSIAAFDVHREGQGEKGKKKQALFPKYVFLYDKELHGEGKINYDVYEAGFKCSQETMYPDWLSLTGEGYVAGVYQGSNAGYSFKKGTVVSPMGCRAFLSPYYKIGKLLEDGTREHFYPAEDQEDEFIATGRFNSGAISLNLPLIYLMSQVQGQDFYDLLDEYLEMIRQIHVRTKRYIGKRRASTNPLAYCEGGFFGGNLDPEQRIEESPYLMDSTTFSFGITALNELQQAYNGKSIAEDGVFAQNVLKHINDKANEFKAKDHMLYAIYGTPAEGLCGKQIAQLRAYVKSHENELAAKGYEIIQNEHGPVINGVCDREYVSNSHFLFA